jgi:hypothetical protein
MGLFTTQPLPLDDSPEVSVGLFQAIKLGIFTPALRAAQRLPRKRRGAGVSLASSRLSSNWDCYYDSRTCRDGQLVNQDSV